MLVAQSSGVSWLVSMSLKRSKLCLSGATPEVLDHAVLDVGDAGRLDRAHLLDLEVARCSC
jgi:hypothetical protein